MRSRCLLVLMLALSLAPSVRAQNSEPMKVSTSVSITAGKDDVKRGWYLYWPAEALQQPRRPMPYPWWPSQRNAPAAPPSEPVAPPLDSPTTVPTNPPPQLHLPRDTQSLPTLPGPTSWGQPTAVPFQPVSYPYYPAPGYWYGR